MHKAVRRELLSQLCLVEATEGVAPSRNQEAWAAPRLTRKFGFAGEKSCPFGVCAVVCP